MITISNANFWSTIRLLRILAYNKGTTKKEREASRKAQVLLWKLYKKVGDEKDGVHKTSQDH